jgi:hypothetical protein
LELKRLLWPLVNKNRHAGAGEPEGQMTCVLRTAVSNPAAPLTVAVIPSVAAKPRWATFIVLVLSRTGFPLSESLTSRIEWLGVQAGGENCMIAAQLASIVLVVTVATGPVIDSGTVIHMSAQQKSAALRPLVHNATECIARAVAADSRSGEIATNGNLGDLIVASMPSCVGPVRAMIDRYDHYFGDGTGEAFFMGPYLEILPTAISRWEKSAPNSSIKP